MVISMAISVIATTVPATRCLPSHTTVIYQQIPSIDFSDQKEKHDEEEEKQGKNELANKKTAHMGFLLMVRACLTKVLNTIS